MRFPAQVERITAKKEGASLADKAKRIRHLDVSKHIKFFPDFLAG